MDVILSRSICLLLPLPMLINSLRADIGVMITASHNTYEYNGLKFFNSKGDKISKKLEITNRKYSI